MTTTTNTVTEPDNDDLDRCAVESCGDPILDTDETGLVTDGDGEDVLAHADCAARAWR